MLERIHGDNGFEAVVVERQIVGVRDYVRVSEDGIFDFNNTIELFARSAGAEIENEAFGVMNDREGLIRQSVTQMVNRLEFRIR